MPSLTLQHIPFLTHILLEVPASLNFLLRPSHQLSSPAPQAHAIIQQYATLLLTSNLIALIFLARRDVDEVSRKVAGALAVYHAAPIVRAVSRLREGRGLRVPLVHAVVHAGALMGLSALYLEML